MLGLPVIIFCFGRLSAETLLVAPWRRPPPSAASGPASSGPSLVRCPPPVSKWSRKSTPSTTSVPPWTAESSSTSSAHSSYSVSGTHTISSRSPALAPGDPVKKFIKNQAALSTLYPPVPQESQNRFSDAPTVAEIFWVPIGVSAWLVIPRES